MARAGNCQEGRTPVTFFQGPLNTVTYRDDILDPIILRFLQQRNFGHVFQHHNAKCHLAHDCQDFMNQNHIRVLPWPA
jgi:hypothetical protein